MSLLRVLALLLVFAVCAAASPARPDSPDNPPPAKKDDKKGQPEVKLPTKAEVMAAKLKQAQALLEALALADYGKAERAADELGRISRMAEILNAYKSEEYLLQINLFRRAAETVARKAKAKNLDGVLVSYMDLTTSCVRCHEETRVKDRADTLPPCPVVTGPR